ncbi:AAA family ATPase [Mycolicibacterium pulveris]|uniref:Cyclase n=1 Tax=Mycolicibacterium pulveris TaxID=36813 RepID=A0A7I7UKE9_MYCPV|nr:AAA family ATPase [Mycolicibacterium pulveris]MCV6980508.1 AAA family ATPase [Mycolicibacterium pulveris]BBY81902.1 cyclase [Mycolicibacterium pulveris]
MTSTAAVCRSCGTGLRQNAKFCHECGAATPGARRAAEYKQVTVVFADVVRSMDIAATLDPERLREVMTSVVERSAAMVRRFGGGVVEYTGDGVMALFGAPVALEDHAFRACLAASAIQDEADRLAREVAKHDGVTLRLRVGLNSGRVIVGEIGSCSTRYAATGETIGLAQRMESAALPGAVLLSESTAHLVESTVTLADPEWVRVRGSDTPVRARRLVSVGGGDGLVGRADASLVGRGWEMAALDGLLDRAAGGRGGVVNVVGPAGIGKSRVAREVATTAAARGVEVFWTFCESHARDIPFHAVTRLLRAGSGVTDVAGDAARARLRTTVPADADPQDLLLLDDLLGVGDPEVRQPQIDPDARRRRLTALINSVTLARTKPALFVIEDAHWIDSVSESLLGDLLAVIPRSPSLVLITSRPEYGGALVRAQHAQTIALAPLGDSEMAALLSELLGDDSSVRELTTIIAERACGNPFFAEEMVRELVQRGELAGDRGHHVCRTAAADVAVPATVQAAIEARIDRMSPSSRRTLSAASVIGARFGLDLLTALQVDAAVDELLAAELIDRVRFAASPEYTFRHPLIRAVAYESQLKTTRAELHRRVAAVIEASAPAAADENAALIAEHLEAADELHAAYQWHMRAATWAVPRDIAAARQSWERAGAIADALPADEPDRTAMRIAPRTMLCGIAWRLHANVAEEHIEELRELCADAGDKASLAIGTAGLVLDRAFQGRIKEASRLASEAWALIDSLHDATLTVGLSFPVIYPKGHGGAWLEVLQWSQRAIDLADGDPSMGNFLFGSPLAIAFTTRAFSRYCMGLPGWFEDLRQGLALARSADPFAYATTVAYVYFPGIPLGVLAAHDRAMGEVEEALRIAERTGDNMALAFDRVILGLALAHRDTDAERNRGQELLAEIGKVFQRDEHSLSELRLLNAYLARERARCGDHDAALALVRAAIDELVREGQLLSWGIPATGVLVETLLDRAGEGDFTEAESAVERLASAPDDGGQAMRDIWLMKLRALLARARGDDATFRELAGRYQVMAQTLGFEGHIGWAEAMVKGRQ